MGVDGCQEGRYNGRMLQTIRFFFRDRIVGYCAGLTVVFIVAQIVILALKIRASDAAIFLHYTTYLGVDFVGAWYLSYLIPLASALVAKLNTALAIHLRKKDTFAGYVLLIGSVLFSVLMLVYVILLTRLNS